MERQIEQLLKEVKGNETLERLVKMNRNPNALFIERIRTMNKGENENDKDKGGINLEAINNRLAKIYEKMKKSTQNKMDEDEDEDEEEIITRSNNPEGYNEIVYEHEHDSEAIKKMLYDYEHDPEKKKEFIEYHSQNKHDDDDELIELEDLESQDGIYWGPTGSELEEPESQDATRDPTGSELEEPESQDATRDPTGSDIKVKKVNWLNNPQGLSLIDFHRLLTENLIDDDSSDDEDIDYSTLPVIDNRKRNKK